MEPDWSRFSLLVVFGVAAPKFGQNIKWIKIQQIFEQSSLLS